MSFDSKFYQLAENELNDRRSRNERILRKNELEISEKHPEIYKINRDIALTSAQLIKLILDHDKDFEVKLAELETNNTFLQKKLAESLVRNGYPSNYLDMPYVCPKCKDKGVYNGKHCECFMEIVKRGAADEINSNSPLSLSEFSDFSLSYYDDKEMTHLGCTARDAMSENLDFCKKYAENFHIPCNGILMRGGTGLGKTHLSLSIANEVIKKGYSVIYGSAPDIFRKCEQEHFGDNGNNTIDTLMETDLLILDDVAAELETKFYTALFYNIINNRMNASKPTIISTNCDLNELRLRYGERVVSRLKTMDDLIFLGSDIRIKRGRNM